MVGVVLDSQAVALIVGLGEGGMYLRVSCGFRSVKNVRLVLSIMEGRTSVIIHRYKAN